MAYDIERVHRANIDELTVAEGFKLLEVAVVVSEAVPGVLTMEQALEVSLAVLKNQEGGA